MFVDFDTCEPYQGAHAAQHRVDINKFGKSVDRQVHSFAINNSTATNKVKFKLFKDGSRQSERLRKFGIGLQSSSEADLARDDAADVGLLAMGELTVCDLQGYKINQPLALVLPLKKVRRERDQRSASGRGYGESADDQFELEAAHALFTITVTD